MSGKRRSARDEREASPSPSTRCSPLVAFVLVAMEIILLALIVLSPWAYGAVHPGFEFLLDAGIALLLTLWAVRMLLEREIIWKNSLVAICLACLFLLGIWQSTPLPGPLLAWLSPGTARCYDQLFPKQPEMLPQVEVGPNLEPPPGSTLSLHHGATQRETGRLLAVFLVFAIVFNNLTSKEALIRLSWVAVINGVLLSLFAFFQYFAAPPFTVYWIFPSQATPFGPFICHNHFPDYVNMCIGLAIGLLVSQSKHDSSSKSSKAVLAPLRILRNPRALGICFAIGFMISAVAFSRSRGGLLALMGAAVLCGVLGWLRLGRSFRIGSSFLVMTGIVVALCAWFGTDVLKSRLASIGSGEAMENRVPLWLRSLPIVADFPTWGTGYGTFGYIEPTYRKDVAPKEASFWYDHAHNDYLEILVEGGVIGLGLAMLALMSAYRLGFRALSANRSSRRAGLALGALFAFTALALHSFAEFGTHIPAIALLGTVVCAYLCALGSTKKHKAREVNKAEGHSPASAGRRVSHEFDTDKYDEDSESEGYRLRLGGIAPLLGAILTLGFGVMLCADSWKAHRIDRLEEAAFRAGSNDPDQLNTRIAYLAEATSLGPENANLHYELGFAHERLAELLNDGNASVGSAVLEHTICALKEHLRARDACPLMSGAQAGIAAYAARLKQGDTAENYLRRAKRLTPGQYEMWFVCGLREFTLKRQEDSWATWRHCLELSPYYLPQILDHTKRLKTSQLVEKVLPDNPEVLLAAALYLYPDFGSVERRRAFLAKALLLLESKEESLGPPDLLVKARIYKALDQPDQAIQVYRELLRGESSRVELRYEFAAYLCETRKLEEAHHELTVLLAREPKHVLARDLRTTVLNAMLEDKSRERTRQRADWWLRHVKQR